MPRPVVRLPWWLALLSAGFAAALILVLIASFLRPSPPTLDPSRQAPHEIGDSLVRNRTYTLDVRDSDRWVFFDFSRGSSVEAPDDLAWDFAARRHRIVVNGGNSFAGSAGVLEVEGKTLDSVRVAPEGEYAGSQGSLHHNPSHRLLDHWYRYNFLTHLLTPRTRIFILKTADGRYAALRILSYYCPGPEPGCLTIRYTYQGAGGRDFNP